MPPEVAAEAPADDIKSLLASAYTEHSEADAPVVPVKTPDAPDKSETARTTDGKFAKKEEAEAVDPPVDKAEPEKTVEVTEPKEEPAKVEVREPPDKWPEDKKELFKKQTPEAQDLILERHKAMEADYTKKTQAIARLKTDYEPVDRMFEPYRDVMKQKGFTPSSLIEAWANVEKKLTSGEQGQLEVLGGLIRGYNIPVQKIAALLGVPTSAKPASESGEVQPPQPTGQSALPPELWQHLHSLTQQVTGLTEAQRRAQQAAVEAQENRVSGEIEQFKSSKDDKGILLNPHFEEVENDMVALANSYVVAKQPIPPLKELYEKAVWANPSTREKLRTAERQSAELRIKDEARAKAAAAKKAGSSVVGAPGSSGQAQASRRSEGLSLREQLLEAADDN